MENKYFLQPIDPELFIPKQEGQNLLSDHILKNFADAPFPDISIANAAIIGVEESRYSVDNQTSHEGSNLVRKHLYQLKPRTFKLNIVDLGNIGQGERVEDTYVALADIITELFENNVIPIIIGGSQDLTYGCYKAYEKLQQIINIVAVDRKFDFSNGDDDTHSENYLRKIILQQPNYLFNYSIIGYQSYYVEQDLIKLMDNLFFDTHRLGMIKGNLIEIEPLIRNCDLLSFDMGAIRAGDSPGHATAGPNGFFGDEACQIARYAGLSDKLSAIGFFEYNSEYDNRELSAQLMAQMIWYFLEGLYNRKNEDPAVNADDFLKYHVSVNSGKDDIVFYRSKNTDRWWMEIGSKQSIKNEYRRHNLIPCSFADYKKACDNDIPDRWWKTFQKLM